MDTDKPDLSKAEKCPNGAKEISPGLERSNYPGCTIPKIISFARWSGEKEPGTGIAFSHHAPRITCHARGEDAFAFDISEDNAHD